MIMLASRSGLPIVPVGVGYSRAWRAGSWDRFAVPRPFSRCVFVAGEAVRVPPDVGREGLEHFRRLAEQRMCEATEAAERIAQGQGGRSAPHFRFRRPRPAARDDRNRGTC
jgi:lysophospholipid acyltransferase (LPLAT)-like uncharacterized protein